MNFTKDNINFFKSIVTKETYIPNDDINSDYVYDLQSDNYSRANFKKIDGVWYYHKNGYNLNEFIGERIAKKLKLDTAAYEICKYNGSLMLRSPNFQLYGYEYKNILEVTNGKYDLDYLEKNGLEILKKDLNFTEEKMNQVLKLIALDIYMRQKDRAYVNLLFKNERNSSDISLAPIYDYTDSFNRPFNKYESAIVKVMMNPNEMHKIFDQYPNVYKYMQELEELDLELVIDKIAERLDLNISEDVKDFYKKEDEYSKRLLRSIR